jgi:hypothetical protein
LYVAAKAGVAKSEQPIIIGVRFRVSGVRKIQRTEHRKQMTDDKGQTVFCLLSSDLCSLTHLTPEH